MKIIPISGGYDSTLLLHMTLKAGESCASHHVHLINSEYKRYAPEAKAYRAVMGEMHRLHGDFLHTTSTHKNILAGWFGWDLLNSTYHSAVATEGHLYLLGKRELELCLAIPKESFRKDESHSIVQDRVEDLWKVYFSHMGIQTKVSYPISHMSKKEILEALPKSLRDLCWTCRNPVNHTEPCGECFSCQMVKGKI
jgi:7-cyano-7-deazaguanine synthase in queuosine biosynthesis